ncbi:MAG: Cell division protein FtsW, partial [uncultured Thermomicrobiales bacterium]
GRWGTGAGASPWREGGGGAALCRARGWSAAARHRCQGRRHATRARLLVDHDPGGAGRLRHGDHFQRHLRDQPPGGWRLVRLLAEAGALGGDRRDGLLPRLADRLSLLARLLDPDPDRLDHHADPGALPAYRGRLGGRGTALAQPRPAAAVPAERGGEGGAGPLHRRLANGARPALAELADGDFPVRGYPRRDDFPRYARTGPRYLLPAGDHRRDDAAGRGGEPEAVRALPRQRRAGVHRAGLLRVVSPRSTNALSAVGRGTLDDGRGLAIDPGAALVRLGRAVRRRVGGESPEIRLAPRRPHRRSLRGRGRGAGFPRLRLSAGPVPDPGDPRLPRRLPRAGYVRGVAGDRYRLLDRFPGADQYRRHHHHDSVHRRAAPVHLLWRHLADGRPGDYRRADQCLAPDDRGAGGERPARPRSPRRSNRRYPPLAQRPPNRTARCSHARANGPGTTRPSREV